MSFNIHPSSFIIILSPKDENSLSPIETKELDFLVGNGHWEVLVKNRTFLILAPENQVQTLAKALTNRTHVLRDNLTPLSRTEKLEPLIS